MPRNTHIWLHTKQNSRINKTHFRNKRRMKEATYVNGVILNSLWHEGQPRKRTVTSIEADLTHIHYVGQ
jgi:hypothetical protein